MTRYNPPPGSNPPETPPPTGGSNYGNRPQDGTNPLAVAGVVGSLASVVACCFYPLIGILVAISGAVLSGLGEKQIREGRGTGMGMATAGRILGIVMSIVSTILLILMIAGFAWANSPAGQQWFQDRTADVD